MILYYRKQHTCCDSNNNDDDNDDDDDDTGARKKKRPVVIHTRGSRPPFHVNKSHEVRLPSPKFDFAFWSGKQSCFFLARRSGVGTYILDDLYIHSNM
jgi:hypothetical protein